MVVDHFFIGIAAAMTVPSALALIVEWFPDPIEQQRGIALFGGSSATGNGNCTLFLHFIASPNSNIAITSLWYYFWRLLHTGAVISRPEANDGDLRWAYALVGQLEMDILSYYDDGCPHCHNFSPDGSSLGSSNAHTISAPPRHSWGFNYYWSVPHHLFIYESNPTKEEQQPL